MPSQQNQTEYAPGQGWELQSATIRREPEVIVEFRFAHCDGRSLRLTLKGMGACGAGTLVKEFFLGFDDFAILRREDITPWAEFGRLLCRLYRNDDRYDTVIDDYETEVSEPEPDAAANAG